MLLYRISHANVLRTVVAKGKSYIAEIAEELIDCFFGKRKEVNTINYSR